MRRKAWFRSLAALLAIWLPLIIGEPGVVHACPAHGAATRASPASGHHSGHGAGKAGQAAASHPAAPENQGPTHDHHDCTCINCCVGSLAAPPASPVATTAFEVAVYAAHVGHSTTSLPRSTHEHSRPYTTGPPRA